MEHERRSQFRRGGRSLTRIADDVRGAVLVAYASATGGKLHDTLCCFACDEALLIVLALCMNLMAKLVAKDIRIRLTMFTLAFAQSPAGASCET